MGTLYIDKKELHIKLDGNALSFYAAGKKEGIVPINPLKRVVVIGSVAIETPVLHRLADENISVVFLSGKRLRFRGMMHGRLHNNGILRLKQYEKSLSEFAMDTARDIVIRKILGQTQLLEEVKQHRAEHGLKTSSAISTLKDVLYSVRHTDSKEVLMGLEGGATAAYFSAYTELFADSLEFDKRTRRPPKDPVNAMLSLCYTLLHYEITREIEVIGLDPLIGFYHRFEYGRESLSCDLVEPYRPDVDRFVYEIFRTRQFAARDFAADDERPGCYLKKGSRQRFYLAYEDWAKEFRQKWRNEARDLARKIMDGQDIIPE